MGMFKKATREAVPIRMLIYGPSGSGKTYTALQIARGLAKDRAVCVIDTQGGESQFYADQFAFDVALLKVADPSLICKAIDEAVREGYGVIVLDSLTHAWDWCLQRVDSAAGRYGGNKHGAWAEITPIWDGLLAKFATCGVHVLVTGRAKTLWDKDDKNKPVKIGQGVKLRDETDYEFVVSAYMSMDHVLHIEKGRGSLDGQSYSKPGPELADILKAEVGGGEAPPVRREVSAPTTQPARADDGQRALAANKRRLWEAMQSSDPKLGWVRNGTVIEARAARLADVLGIPKGEGATDAQVEDGLALIANGFEALSRPNPTR